ncbi:MAG: hypothetical protein IMZ52_08030 [Actinobacteria bacterium]|nr:hypothetical protein [Actinomycetota bacterium]MBE3114637.1 hypothetical protein [Actinomycetota bacterium]
MKLTRNNTFNNPILLIDGHGGSGKSKVSRVLECFDGVEKSKEDEMFHMILHLHRIGKIEDDVAKVMLNTITDRLTYNQLISREINFKLSDVTSILKYPYPLEYIKRVFYKDKDEICNKINDNYPILQNMTTNAIISSNILFESFGERLKIIYIRMNPIVTIYNMFKSGFGRNVGVDPTNIMLTYEGNISVDMNEYADIIEMDRVIRWVYSQSQLVKKSYESLKPELKERIMIIDFEAFTKYPYSVCNHISGFIHKKPTWKLNVVINKLYPETRNSLLEKKEFIKKYATENAFKLIDEI